MRVQRPQRYPIDRPASRLRTWWSTTRLRTPVSFDVVGLGGMVIDVGVFNALRLGLFGHGALIDKPLTAAVISASLAIIFNWLGNRYWTFRLQRRAGIARELLEYSAVAVLGLGVGLLPLAVSHYGLGLHSLAADNIAKNIVGLGLGTVVRFALSRWWVWGANRDRPAAGRVAAAGTTQLIIGADPVSPTSTLVIIPTYDERANIEGAVNGVLAALSDAHVLIVDDASPDGTGELADELAGADPRVHVLHRRSKDGLGGAYLEGFAWALEHGYGYVGEFDADGSHPSSALPAMRDALADDPGVALVIGSRWVPGGSVVDWPLSRRLLSRGGNAYARIALGLRVRDVTAGFRLYRASTLRAIDLGSVTSKGYCFQIDLTVRVLAAGGSIAEVPIEFRERRIGVSKMSRAVVLEAMWLVTVWGVARVLGGPGRWLAARMGTPVVQLRPAHYPMGRP